MTKYICVHGHFYQPPRENPWLEAVELQDSASPYHDWNERVTAECYAPNAHARLMDGHARIERIVNNYSGISFNFGPTVLAWMKEKASDILQAIVDGDKASREQFSGHGTAIAQCYNHMIMPLANRRDKFTQVVWGIRDFESHFGRPPEGMWLPETAADDESLDVLAEAGIKFTILSPFQASRIRPIGTEEWQDVNGGKVDPARPYVVKLPSGRSIAVFFYDGGVAKSIAFESLLRNGESLGRRLIEAFNPDATEDQLVNVATDGESYGHHFNSGDMALAYALRWISEQGQAKLTNYGEFLEKHPPKWEAQIHQASAWSCSHGVGRWERDCGCNSGGHAGWNQKWREPLRNAMNWLRDKLADCYERHAKDFLKDPWAARNAYINVILDRSPDSLAKFFQDHATHGLNLEEQTQALRLLEMQRHALLMFTSCAWFFDEISGLETVQVIQYAARAIQISNGFGEKFEDGFLDILDKAESNLSDPHTGRQIYERYVKPSIMTREAIAAHFAISSLFRNYADESRIYSFTVHQEDRQNFTVGKTRLATGRIKIEFEITRSSDTLTYAAFHTGDQNINCAVREDGDVEAYKKMTDEMRAAFEHGDFPEMIRVMDRHFGPTHYSIEHLFRDEQRAVLNEVLAGPAEEIYNTLHHITDHYAPLRRFMSALHSPPLKVLSLAAEISINSGLRRMFEAKTLEVEKIKALLSDCAATHVPLDSDILAYALKTHFDHVADRLMAAPDDLEALQDFIAAAELTGLVPFKVNMWKPQNIYNKMILTTRPKMQQCADKGNAESKKWVEKFDALGEKLGFLVLQQEKAKAA